MKETKEEYLVVGSGLSLSPWQPSDGSSCRVFGGKGDCGNGKGLVFQEEVALVPSSGGCRHFALISVFLRTAVIIPDVSQFIRVHFYDHGCIQAAELHRYWLHLLSNLKNGIFHVERLQFPQSSMSI